MQPEGRRDRLEDVYKRQLNFPALGKPEILEYLKNNPEAPDLVKDVLAGRLALSKTSTKKYIAMLNCAAKDRRAHGLFQFYGANRTGRWSVSYTHLDVYKRQEYQ